MNRALTAALPIFVMSALVAAPSSARAEVLEITATVETTTDQFVTGEPQSSERAFEDFPGTSNLLPIEAATALVRQGPAGVDGQGRGTSLFNQPNLLAVGNPQDVGLSALAFSTVDGLNYVVTTHVVERRELVVTPLESSLPAGTEVTLASSLFPIGGMAVWAEPGAATDLNGAFVEGSVIIVHHREVIQADGSTAEQQVQLGSLEFALQGQADGTARFTLSINGQLVLDNVLADVPVGPLAGLAGGQIFIPALPIPYQYAAIVGDANTPQAPFKLELTAEVRCANQRGGVGAAAVLGAPLFETGVADALAKTIRDARNGVVPPEAHLASASPLAAFGSLCGALGVESALLLLFAAAWGLRCGAIKH